jgi:hypothetical protein
MNTLQQVPEYLINEVPPFYLWERRREGERSYFRTRLPL